MKRACPCSTPFRMVAQMHLERLPGYAPELNRNLDDAKGDEDCTASVRISEATAERSPVASLIQTRQAIILFSDRHEWLSRSEW